MHSAVSFCTVRRYAHKQDWVNMRPQDQTILTLCRPDGLLIKYPQFPDLLNALNVQPHNIFLLTV